MLNNRPKRNATRKPPSTNLYLDSDSEDDNVFIPHKKTKIEIKHADTDSSNDERTYKKKKLPLTKKCNTTPKTCNEKLIKSLKPAGQKVKTTKNTKAKHSSVKGEGNEFTTNLKLQNESTLLYDKYYQPWTQPQLLSELQNIDVQTSLNIIQLFEKDNTIPFICRYRKELIGDITPDGLRDIKITYKHILNVQLTAETIIKNLEKTNKLTSELKCDIKCAKTLDELEHLYAPYKPASKASLAERAKSYGLQEPAENLLYGNGINEIKFENFLNKMSEGLDTIDKIKDGIKHIISHIISKNTKVLEEIRKLQKFHQIYIQSTKLAIKKIKVTEKDTKKLPTSSRTNEFNEDITKTKTENSAVKFENYFDFKCNIFHVKPHQILAINRGENLKVLSVKMLIPEQFKMDLFKFIQNEYLYNGSRLYKNRMEIFNVSFEEAYNKKLQPLICRQLRNELTKIAEKASVEVFGQNLKQLLLMSPVKGVKVLGIDPGFSNGCKIALISECSNILYTNIIFPHSKSNYNKHSNDEGEKLAVLLNKFGCKLIALGNGTACRETERWLTHLFNNGILDSKIVKYSIVTEQGASIYSCSDIAKKEFPDMNINLISAVSIARRLVDPLGEFVKVEPKHLGVGMYQHDINEKILSETLNEVVMECVSFVGVDINTASVAVLRHIAGLTSVRAENILKYRIENGPFQCRDDLKKVKLIGDKTFTQCAGFIRIEPLTASITKTDKHYNIFDSTWIHPESYELSEKIIRKLKLDKNEIGTNKFIEIIKMNSNKNTYEIYAKEFKKPEERIKSIFEALQRELLRDYRSDFDKKPLFKQGITKITDLKNDVCVTGAITNITHFGCFVDIGVEKDGLIHVSKLNGMKPTIGDRIEATVLNVDIARSRIQLKLQNIL